MSERASDVSETDRRGSLPRRRTGIVLWAAWVSNPRPDRIFHRRHAAAAAIQCAAESRSDTGAAFARAEIFPCFVPSHLPATNLGGAFGFRLRELTTGDVSYLTQVSGIVRLSAAIARLSDEQLHFLNFEQSRNRYRYLNNNGTTENPRATTVPSSGKMRISPASATQVFTGKIRPLTHLCFS